MSLTQKIKHFVLHEVPLGDLLKVVTATLFLLVMFAVYWFGIWHAVYSYLVWDVPLWRYYNVFTAGIFTGVVMWFFFHRRREGFINNRLGIKWLLCFHYMEHAMYNGLSFTVLGFGAEIAKYSSIEPENEECIIVKEDSWFLTSFFHMDKSWDGQGSHNEFTFVYLCFGRKPQLFFNLVWTSPFKIEA